MYVKFLTYIYTNHWKWALIHAKTWPIGLFPSEMRLILYETKFSFVVYMLTLCTQVRECTSIRKQNKAIGNTETIIIIWNARAYTHKQSGREKTLYSIYLKTSCKFFRCCSVVLRLYTQVVSCIYLGFMYLCRTLSSIRLYHFDYLQRKRENTF